MNHLDLPAYWDREGIERELRLTIAEQVRRLALALREGDLDTARLMWKDGTLADRIAFVLAEKLEG